MPKHADQCCSCQACRLPSRPLAAPSNAAHLRVGAGAQVAVEEGGGGVEQLAQLVGVGQVAVVDQVDAQRGVDKEGLQKRRQTEAVTNQPKCRSGDAQRGVDEEGCATEQTAECRAAVMQLQCEIAPGGVRTTPHAQQQPRWWTHTSNRQQHQQRLQHRKQHRTSQQQQLQQSQQWQQQQRTWASEAEEEPAVGYRTCPMPTEPAAQAAVAANSGNTGRWQQCSGHSGLRHRTALQPQAGAGKA